MAVGRQPREEMVQAQIPVDNEAGGEKDCAQRSQGTSSPRDTEAGMTKAWNACDGGIWSITSAGSLSFDLKGAGSRATKCLVG